MGRFPGFPRMTNKTKTRLTEIRQSSLPRTAYTDFNKRSGNCAERTKHASFICRSDEFAPLETATWAESDLLMKWSNRESWQLTAGTSYAGVMTSQQNRNTHSYETRRASHWHGKVRCRGTLVCGLRVMFYFHAVTHCGL